MIMAAGVGSRLMPLTLDIPKPMVPMANRPLMEIIIDELRDFGIGEMIANLHYHAGVIRDYFGDGSNFGVSIAYSPEKELMGTAGGVKLCEWFFDDTFIIVSGDALTDIDLHALVTEHRAKGALATIALKEVLEVEQFGVVVCDDEGRIERFQEKPRREEALSNLVNTGIYVFEPEIFKYIPAHQFYDFAKQVFPQLIKSGAPFYGTCIDSYWCDIGSLGTYHQAHLDMLNGKMAIEPRGDLVRTGQGDQVLLGEGVRIGDDVSFSGQVVLGPGCTLEGNIHVENSVLWENVQVASGTVIKNALIGADCRLGQQVRVEAGSVIASGCRVDDGTGVAKNTRVFNCQDGVMKLEQG
ncbi:MAG: sugar phosphate nucleotidyltransferase [Deltaproteobacteria bacterium]